MVRLAKACGWLEELEALWATTAPKQAGLGPEKTKDEKLEDEINKLTAEIDESLNLSKWHQEKVRGSLPSLLPKTSSPDSDQQPNSSGSPSFDNVLHHDPNGNLGHVFVSNAREDGRGKNDSHE